MMTMNPLQVERSNICSCVCPRAWLGGLDRCHIVFQVCMNKVSQCSHQGFCIFFRDCANSSLVKDLATFHIYFDLSHIPAQVPKQDSLLLKVIIWKVFNTRSIFSETKLFAAWRTEEHGDIQEEKGSGLPGECCQVIILYINNSWLTFQPPHILLNNLQAHKSGW